MSVKGEEIPLPSAIAERVIAYCTNTLGYDSPRIQTFVACNPGDGYLSLVIRANVTSDSQKEPISLIVKAVLQNAERREEIRSQENQLNEVAMYNALDILGKFMHQKNLSKTPQYPDTPRFYLSQCSGDANDFLLLEDLGARGFSMADCSAPLSSEHCRLLVAALARLNATSRAFEIQNPKEFEKLRSNIKEVILRENVPMIDMFAEIAPKTLVVTANRFPEGTTEHAKLRNLADNFKAVVLEGGIPSPDGFNVLGHGDCWINNMMFKINPKTNIPEEVSIIDWQTAHYCSPALDLCHFLFSSTDRDTRGHSSPLSEFLELYVQQFNKHVEALGSPEGAISLQILNDHMKRYARVALAFGTSFIPENVRKASKNHAVPASDGSFDESDALSSLFANWDRNNPFAQEAEKRLCDLIEDVIKLGYL